MYMIEITEKKLDKMSMCLEDILRAGGKMMSCIDELKHGSMGYRDGSGYGNREGGYGRYGERESDMWDSRGHIGMRHMGYRDDDDMDDMGERRRRRSNGRFY